VVGASPPDPISRTTLYDWLNDQPLPEGDMALLTVFEVCRQASELLALPDGRYATLWRERPTSRGWRLESAAP
jgi:hypothetical protein